MSIEAMKQMVEALEEYEFGIESIDYLAKVEKAAAIGRQAIAEAEKQEPVAWLHKQGNFTEACMNALHDDEIDRGWTQESLYTSPPQRQPLTDDEIADLWSAQIFHINDLKLAKDFVRDIEAAHGIKENNNG